MTAAEIFAELDGNGTLSGYAAAARKLAPGLKPLRGRGELDANGTLSAYAVFGRAEARPQAEACPTAVRKLAPPRGRGELDGNGTLPAPLRADRRGRSSLRRMGTRI